MNEFTEYELLTLREGLFSYQKYHWDKLSDSEFENIDKKIKERLENMK